MRAEELLASKGILWVEKNKGTIKIPFINKFKKTGQLTKQQLFWKLGKEKGQFMVGDKGKFLSSFGFTGEIKKIPEPVLKKMRITPTIQSNKILIHFEHLTMAEIFSGKDEEKEMYYETIVTGYKLKKIFEPEKTKAEIEKEIKKRYEKMLKELETERVEIFFYEDFLPLYQKTQRSEKKRKLIK